MARKGTPENRRKNQRNKTTHPVKNKFPILAPEKLKVELGLNLFRISKLIKFRKLRISSFFAVEMFVHSG